MKVDIEAIIEKKAKEKPVKIVICEGWDERVLQASAKVIEENLGQIILLGNPEDIKAKASELGVDISKAEIVDFKNSTLKTELAEKLVEVRKHKGMTLEKAQALIEDPNYFGCMYAHAGYADAVAGSAICPTAELMRPALQILRGKGLVSELLIFNDKKNDKYIFMTDGSLNIEPTSEQLAHIALNAIECVKEFDIEPKVAFLSFSTKGSGGDGPQVTLVRDAVKMAQELAPDVIIDGEMQFDAAVSPFGAKRKCPDSPLKGEANVVVFPNLTAANIFVHGMMQFSDSTLDFTLIRGLVKPVTILGRSTPVDTMKGVIMTLAMEVNSK